MNCAPYLNEFPASWNTASSLPLPNRKNQYTATPIKKKCKILKIANHRGNPHYHIEFDDKIYAYGFRGIKTDFSLILRCQKTKCNNTSFIKPSSHLREIIFDKPKGHKTKYCKSLDRNDSRLYDIKNYDINTFEFCSPHKCDGFENIRSNFSKPATNIKIARTLAEQKNGSLLAITEYSQVYSYRSKHISGRKYSQYHIKIGDRVFQFVCKGVKSDFDFSLSCYVTNCRGSGNLTPKMGVFDDRISRSDPKKRTLKYVLLDFCAKEVVNLDNYFCESFKTVVPHSCEGVYLESFQREIESYNLTKESAFSDTDEVIQKIEPLK